MPYVQVYSATKVFCDFMTEGLNYELKEFGVDVCGIRSFGIDNSPSLLTVTPQQCIKESLSKCTSGLHFGAFKHELLGTLITNILDMIPYEGRMFMTADLGKKLVEDKKGIKI